MTKTNDEFRTASDNEKLSKAAKVCAKHDDLVSSATSALAAAEASCAEDPSDANMKNAKAARSALEDAEQGAVLARQHQEKVAAEVAAAETKAIKKTIAHLESTRTEVADADMRILAIEAACHATAIVRGVKERVERRRSEIDALNALRVRVGDAVENVPSAHEITNAALIELRDLGLTAQGLLELRTDSADAWPVLPLWKAERGGIQYLRGARYENSGIWTGGQERADRMLSTAAELLDRVKATRGDRFGGSPIASVAAAGASVIALATAAALTMVGG